MEEGLSNFQALELCSKLSIINMRLECFIYIIKLYVLKHVEVVNISSVILPLSYLESREDLRVVIYPPLRCD